jgi:membrane-bound lytic murein transglycosylase B
MAGRLFLLISFLALLLAGFPAAALDRAVVERKFADWLERDLWPEAKAAGVSRVTFEKAFAGVKLDWDMPEIAPPGTKPQIHTGHQAEFRAPAAYFKEENLAALARCLARSKSATASRAASSSRSGDGRPASERRRFRTRRCGHWPPSPLWAGGRRRSGRRSLPRS